MEASNTNEKATTVIAAAKIKNINLTIGPYAYCPSLPI
jgi:hypothetical protein